MHSCLAGTRTGEDIIIYHASGEGGKATIHHKYESESNTVLSYSYKFSGAGRFSEYTTSGQSAGTATIGGDEASKAIGTAKDNAVEIYRPKLVLIDGNFTSKIASSRAEWEARRRLGQSLSIELTVQGFYNNQDELWSINSMVSLDSDFISYRGELVVASVSFSYSNKGEVTILSLKPLSALTPMPKTLHKKGKKGLIPTECGNYMRGIY